MNPEFVIDAVRKAISRELEIDPAELRDDASLRRQYHLDSVAAVNIIFDLERALDIDIDVRTLAGIDSIDDLKALVAEIYSAS